MAQFDSRRVEEVVEVMDGVVYMRSNKPNRRIISFSEDQTTVEKAHKQIESAFRDTLGYTEDELYIEHIEDPSVGDISFKVKLRHPVFRGLYKLGELLSF